MDLKEHFTVFYESILADPRITSVHISMYMALLLAYLLHENEKPIQMEYFDRIVETVSAHQVFACIVQIYRLIGKIILIGLAGFDLLIESDALVKIIQHTCSEINVDGSFGDRKWLSL